MNIYTTATDEFGSFKEFFHGHNFQLLPKNYDNKLDIDLLLFPGGADVHPKRYHGSVPGNSIYNTWLDENRDEWEFKVFSDIHKMNINPKKVLGVCRGVQFLNVAMGGLLTYDIATRYGKPHHNTHEISWMMETVFSSVRVVNSIHHQAIYGTGDNIKPRTLGVEPNTSITEAIMWGSMYLGFQFHPELLGNKTEMRIFSEGILDWVKGKNNIVTGSPSQDDYPKKKKAMWVNEEEDSPAVQAASYAGKGFEFKVSKKANLKQQEAELLKFLQETQPHIEVDPDTEEVQTTGPDWGSIAIGKPWENIKEFVEEPDDEEEGEY